MIFNTQELFSDKQVITATTVSTNVVDLGVAGTPYDAAGALNYDLGKGNMVPLVAMITESFNNLTSLKIGIEVGDTTALGTEIASETISLADLTAGEIFSLVNLPTKVDKRYLGFRYTVTGTAPSAGRITAGITMGTQTNLTGA